MWKTKLLKPPNPFIRLIIQKKKKKVKKFLNVYILKKIFDLNDIIKFLKNSELVKYNSHILRNQVGINHLRKM